MEMVQEQRLQLTMKFLLGYNMKIVVLWGIFFFFFFFFFWGGGGIFPGGRRLSKECADEGISVK